MEVERKRHLRRVKLLLREFPVVALIGARQVGKTTLARQLTATRKGPTAWFDLENPAHLVRLADPGLELRLLEGLVVLDEIHRLPEVFPLLRTLADRPGTPARFLVLGSASPPLLRQTSETLAGRVAFHELEGFGLGEVNQPERLWLRGGFPRSFLAASKPASRRWRNAFIDTFLSRDVPEFGGAISPTTLRRFWTMLAHWHGEIWNGAEFGRAFGVSPYDHRALPGFADLVVCHSSIAALVRKRRQTTSALTQGLCSRFRHPARAAQPCISRRRSLAPEGGRILGGLRDFPSHAVARGSS